ncbi:MAG: hypothetical protein JWO06_1636, partial [Bacteroidota bacterium]|nr:hypothetical protein [Bacteroidota bacterium]
MYRVVIFLPVISVNSMEAFARSAPLITHVKASLAGLGKTSK